MEEKDRDLKRARTVRSDYVRDVDAVTAWIQRAELRVQDRSAEPQVLRDHLQQVQAEIGATEDRLERLSRNARTIAENTQDEAEKARVQATVRTLTEQLQQVRTWLHDKKQQVGDSLDAWARFMSLHQAVLAWVEEHTKFLATPLQLSSLTQARQRLHDYSTALRSSKQAGKNLSDMSRELEQIGQVTAVGDLPEKLQAAEEAKMKVEALLLERNALLQETSEEWERCERKMKDVRSWMEKTQQSLDSPQNRKRPLRDQHANREKMLADASTQKTKIALSVEKLQIHFRSGVGGNGKVTEEASQLINELDRLMNDIKEQTTTLEACLSQIDQYQHEIQQLRTQIVSVEAQLRSALSPNYSPHDRDRALHDQNDMRVRVELLLDHILRIDPNWSESGTGEAATRHFALVEPDISYADIAAGRISPCPVEQPENKMLKLSSNAFQISNENKPDAKPLSARQKTTETSRFCEAISNIFAPELKTSVKTKDVSSDLQPLMQRPMTPPTIPKQTSSSPKESKRIRKSVKESRRSPSPSLRSAEKKGDSRGRTRLPQNEEVLECLALPQTFRGRSPSPLFIPGETASFAQVLRSRNTQDQQISDAAIHDNAFHSKYIFGEAGFETGLSEKQTDCGFEVHHAPAISTSGGLKSEALFPMQGFEDNQEIPRYSYSTSSSLPVLCDPTPTASALPAAPVSLSGDTPEFFPRSVQPHLPLFDENEFNVKESVCDSLTATSEQAVPKNIQDSSRIHFDSLDTTNSASVGDNEHNTSQFSYASILSQGLQSFPTQQESPGVVEVITPKKFTSTAARKSVLPSKNPVENDESQKWQMPKKKSTKHEKVVAHPQIPGLVLSESSPKKKGLVKQFNPKVTDQESPVAEEPKELVGKYEAVEKEKQVSRTRQSKRKAMPAKSSKSKDEDEIEKALKEIEAMEKNKKRSNKRPGSKANKTAVVMEAPQIIEPSETSVTEIIPQFISTDSALTTKSVQTKKKRKQRKTGGSVQAGTDTTHAEKEHENLAGTDLDKSDAKDVSFETTHTSKKAKQKGAKLVSFSQPPATLNLDVNKNRENGVENESPKEKVTNTEPSNGLLNALTSDPRPSKKSKKKKASGITASLPKPENDAQNAYSLPVNTPAIKLSESVAPVNVLLPADDSSLEDRKKLSTEKVASTPKNKTDRKKLCTAETLPAKVENTISGVTTDDNNTNIRDQVSDGGRLDKKRKSDKQKKSSGGIDEAPKPLEQQRNSESCKKERSHLPSSESLIEKDCSSDQNTVGTKPSKSLNETTYNPEDRETLEEMPKGVEILSEAVAKRLPEKCSEELTKQGKSLQNPSVSSKVDSTAQIVEGTNVTEKQKCVKALKKAKDANTDQQAGANIDNGNSLKKSVNIASQKVSSPLASGSDSKSTPSKQKTDPTEVNSLEINDEGPILVVKASLEPLGKSRPTTQQNIQNAVKKLSVAMEDLVDHSEVAAGSREQKEEKEMLALLESVKAAELANSAPLPISSKLTSYPPSTSSACSENSPKPFAIKLDTTCDDWLAALEEPITLEDDEDDVITDCADQKQENDASHDSPEPKPVCILSSVIQQTQPVIMKLGNTSDDWLAALEEPIILSDDDEDLRAEQCNESLEKGKATAMILSGCEAPQEVIKVGSSAKTGGYKLESSTNDDAITSKVKPNSPASPSGPRKQGTDGNATPSTVGLAFEPTPPVPFVIKLDSSSNDWLSALDEPITLDDEDDDSKNMKTSGVLNDTDSNVGANEIGSYLSKDPIISSSFTDSVTPQKLDVMAQERSPSPLQRRDTRRPKKLAAETTHTVGQAGIFGSVKARSKNPRKIIDQNPLTGETRHLNAAEVLDPKEKQSEIVVSGTLTAEPSVSFQQLSSSTGKTKEERQHADSAVSRELHPGTPDKTEEKNQSDRSAELLMSSELPPRLADENTEKIKTVIEKEAFLPDAPKGSNKKFECFDVDFWQDKWACHEAEKKWQTKLAKRTNATDLTDTFKPTNNDPDIDGKQKKTAEEPNSSKKGDQGAQHVKSKNGSDVSGSTLGKVHTINASLQETSQGLQLDSESLCTTTTSGALPSPSSSVNLKDKIVRDTAMLAAAVAQSEKELEALPAHSLTAMHGELERILSELMVKDAVAARVQDNLDCLPQDEETLALSHGLSEVRAHLAELVTHLLQGRAAIQNAEHRGMSREQSLTQYQALLADLERWFSSASQLVSANVQDIPVAELQNQLSAHKRLGSELRHHETRLQQLSDICAALQRQPDTQHLAPSLLSQLTSLQDAFQELSDVVPARIAALQASLLVLSPGSTISSGASPIHSEEMPARGKDIGSQTGDSLRGPKSQSAQTDSLQRSHIQVLKKVDGDHEVIEFVTMPDISTSTSYLPSTSPTSSLPLKNDDLLVQVKYKDKHQAEGLLDNLQSELSILHMEPQSFETVLVDPGETTTEVIVDAQGNKRVIVRQVRRTLVTQQQVVSSQRQELHSVSTRDGHLVPESEQTAFSQIVLQSQQTAVSRQQDDGSTHVTQSKDYTGRIATGVDGGSVLVSDFRSQPPSNSVTLHGIPTANELMRLDRAELEGRIISGDSTSQITLPIELDVDSQELITSASSVRATVQQVSRRVVRQKRKVIRKIVIIDGKEHVTEEVVDEPEEIEESGESIPRVSIEINRSGDRGAAEQERGYTSLPSQSYLKSQGTSPILDRHRAESLESVGGSQVSIETRDLGSNGRLSVDAISSSGVKGKSPSVFSRFAKRTKKAFKKAIGSEGQEYVVTPDDEIQGGAAEYYVSTEELSPSPGASPITRRTKQIHKKAKGPDGKEYDEEIVVTEDGTDLVRTIRRVIKKVVVVDGKEQVVEEIVEIPCLDDSPSDQAVPQATKPSSSTLPSERPISDSSTTPSPKTKSLIREKESPPKESRQKERWSIKETLFGTPKLKRQKSKEKSTEHEIKSKKKMETPPPPDVCDDSPRTSTQPFPIEESISRKEKSPGLSDDKATPGKDSVDIPTGGGVVEDLCVAVKAPSRSPSPEKVSKIDIKEVVSDFVKNEQMKHEGYPEKILPLLGFQTPVAPPRRNIPDRSRSNTPTPAPRASVSPQRPSSPDKRQPVEEDIITETKAKRAPFGGVLVGVKVPEDAVRSLKKAHKTTGKENDNLTQHEEEVPNFLAGTLGTTKGSISSWQVTTTKTVIPTVVTREVKKTRRIVKKVSLVDGREVVTEEILDEPEESVTESVITGEPTTTVFQEKQTKTHSPVEADDEADGALPDYYISREAMKSRPNEKVEQITVVKKSLSNDGAEQTVVIHINETDETVEKTQLLSVKTVTKIVYVVIYPNANEHVTETDFEVLPNDQVSKKQYRVLRKIVRFVKVRDGSKVVTEEKEESEPNATYDDMMSAINDIAKKAPKLPGYEHQETTQSPSPPERKKRGEAKISKESQVLKESPTSPSKYGNILKVKIIRKVQSQDGKERVTVEKHEEPLPEHLINPQKSRIVRRVINVTVRPDGSEEISQEDTEESSPKKPGMLARLVKDTKDMMKKVVSNENLEHQVTEIHEPPSPMAEYYDPLEEITTHPGEHVKTIKFIRTTILPDGTLQTTEEDMEQEMNTSKGKKGKEKIRQITKVVYQLTYPTGDEIYTETDAEEIKPGKFKIIRKVISIFKTENGSKTLISKDEVDVRMTETKTIEEIVDEMAQKVPERKNEQKQEMTLTSKSKTSLKAEENIIITRTIKKSIAEDGSEQTTENITKDLLPADQVDPEHPIIIRKTIYIVIGPDGQEHVTQEYVEEEADIDLECPIAQLVRKTRIHFPEIYLSEEEIKGRKNEWLHRIQVIRTVQKSDGKEQTTEGEVSEPQMVKPKEANVKVVKIIYAYVPLEGNEIVVETDLKEIQPGQYQVIRRTIRTIAIQDGRKTVCEENVEEPKDEDPASFESIRSLLQTNITKHLPFQSSNQRTTGNPETMQETAGNAEKQISKAHSFKQEPSAAFIQIEKSFWDERPDSKITVAAAAPATPEPVKEPVKDKKDKKEKEKKVKEKTPEPKTPDTKSKDKKHKEKAPVVEDVKSKAPKTEASPKTATLERQSTPVGENIIKVKIIRKVIGPDGKETVTEEKREEPMPAALIDPARPRVIKRTIYIVVRPDGQEEVTQEDVDEHPEGGKPSIFSRLRKIIRKVIIGPDGKEQVTEEEAHFPELYVTQDDLKKRPDEWVRRVKLIRRVQLPDGSEQTTEEDAEEPEDAMPKGAKKKVTKLVYVIVLPDGKEQVVETDLDETKPGKFRVIRRVVRTITVKDGKRQVLDEKVEEPQQDEKPSALDKIISAVSIAFAPKEAKPEEVRPDLRPPTADFIQVERSFWDERPDPKITVAAAAPATPEPVKEPVKDKKDKKEKEKKVKEKTPEPKTPDTKSKDKKHKEKAPVVEDVKSKAPKTEASPKTATLERQSTPVGENIIKVKIIRKVIGPDGKETVTEEKREEPMPAALIDPARPRVIKRTIYIVVRPDGQEEVTQEDVDEHPEGGKPSIFSRLRKIIRKVIIGPDGKEQVTEEEAHFPELYVTQDDLKKRPDEWVRRVKLIRRVQLPDGSEQTTEEDAEEPEDAMPKGAKKKVTKLVYVIVLPDGKEQVVETDLDETKPGKFRVIRRVVRTITVKDGKRQVLDEKVEEPQQDEKPSALDKIISAVSIAFAPKEAKPEEVRPDLRPPTADFIQVERSFWDERPDPKITVAAAAPATPEPVKEPVKDKKDKKEKEKKVKEKTPEPKTPDTKSKDKKHKEKAPVVEDVKSKAPKTEASPKTATLERQSTPVGENIIKVKIIRKVIGPDGKETVTEEKREEPMPAALIDPARPRVIKRTIYIVVRPDGQEEVTQEDVDEHPEGGKPSIFSRLRKIIRKVIIGPDGKEQVTEEEAHFPELYVTQDDLKKRPDEWVRRVKLIRRVQLPDGSEQTTEEDAEEPEDAMPKGAKKKVTKLVYVIVLPDGKEQVVETDLDETKPGKFRVIRRVVRTITVKDGKRQVLDEKVEEPQQDEKPSALDKIISAVSIAFAPKEAKPEEVRPDLRPPTADFIQVERSFWDERPDPKITVAAAAPATPEPVKEPVKDKKDKKEKEKKVKEKTPEPKTPDTKSKDKKHKEKAPVVEDVKSKAPKTEAHPRPPPWSDSRPPWARTSSRSRSFAR
ncbi:uncharacterized protein LOC117645652 isoform X2 [Thrips palmi]|uniref:Uncharacterized protein LOC117645652 isoform X2 n=1 Tax=Thrips palmi TaxID=161013 RepID=A0A6P8ZN67_THRPL|nr:uncharacterized protein LOC117645652 isoform X2 [Thrips palmi]